MAVNRIDLRFPAGPQAPGLARHALSQLSGEIREDVLQNVSLLVSELVTNSVRHAGLGRRSAIIMSVQVCHEAVRVEVFDEGPGFEPVLPSPTFSQDSGWGLYLVRRVADRWGVSHEGMTRVWFEIDQRGNQMSARS
jgi:anti-sigma regulatory factor (Ser/Thr protein kinase)